MQADLPIVLDASSIGAVLTGKLVFLALGATLWAHENTIRPPGRRSEPASSWLESGNG